MKVWFGCTTIAWKDYRENYFAIRNELVRSGAIILHDWIDFADEVAEGRASKHRNKKVYQQVMDAIQAADVVVIESTVPNFSTSHQISFALLRRKPTLVLRLHQEKNLFSDSYIDSISDPNLTVQSYDLDSLASVLGKFVKLNSLSNAQGRYNIVLEKKHKYYLDWLSQNSAKSRSHIIRELIESEMLTDQKFEKYLETVS